MFKDALINDSQESLDLNCRNLFSDDENEDQADILDSEEEESPKTRLVTFQSNCFLKDNKV